MSAGKEQAFAAEDFSRLRIVQGIADIEHFARGCEIFRAQATRKFRFGLAVNVADAQDLVEIVVHAEPTHLAFQFPLFGYGQDNLPHAKVLQAVQGIERVLLQPASVLHIRVVDNVHIFAGQFLIGRFIKLKSKVAVVLPDGEAKYPLVRVYIRQGFKPVPL